MALEQLGAGGASSPAPGMGTAPQLADYLRVFQRRRGVVLGVFFVSLTVGIVLSLLLPKKYTAETKVALRERSFVDAISGETPLDVPLKQKLETLNSEMKAFNNMERILEDLVQMDEYAWLEYASIRHDEAAKREYFQRLAKNLQIEIQKQRQGDNLVTFTYKDTSPERAAMFAEQAREVWKDSSVDFFTQSLRENVQVQRDIVEKHRKEWERTVAEYETYEQTYNAGAKGTVESNQNRKGSLERDRDTLMIDLRGAKAKYELVSQELEQLSPTSVKARQVRNPRYEAQQARVDGLRQQLDSLLQTKKEDHPQVKKMRAELQTQEESLNALPPTLSSEEVQQDNPYFEQKVIEKNQLLADISEYERQLEFIELELAKVSRQLETLPAILQERRQRKNRADTQELLLQQAMAVLGPMEDRLRRLENERAYNPFEVLEPAFPPKSPSEPNVAVILGIAAAAGLILGGAIAVLLEFAKTSFSTADEVAGLLGVPVLGMTDLIVTGVERRRQRFRRTVKIGAAVALLVIVAGGVVFAIKFPERLPPFLQETLDAFQFELG